MTISDSQNAGREHPHGGAWRALRAAAVSLPGKLLGLAILFVMLAEILIYFPSAAAFRNNWFADRAEAAHLAALAAENAQDMDLGEESVRELLDGADVLAVARVYDGVNELVLGGEIGDAPLTTVKLYDQSLWDSLVGTCDTLLTRSERYVRIIAVPETRPDEMISVLVPEAPLREALLGYSARIAGLSVFISLVTGGLIYLSLMLMFVRPMRRLARAMTAFQEDPTDPSRTLPVSGRNDEIGQAEQALAAMQDDVRAAFRQRERLAALGGAVAKINHDLRNVLASAQLVSDRLAMSSDERVAAMGARLVRAIDRGVRLCSDTLAYGRAEERPPQMESVGLRNALDDAAGDAFASVGAAEWRNEVDESVRVRADRDALHRIFLNLVRNAVQAMEKSETRDLSVSADAVDETTIAVRVRDTGPGVPERVRETLFEPFGATASKAGAGLGLSIVRELARAMGGEASLAESGPDGSVFEVRLQAAG
ncbi:sensor histidine kinase [Marinicauda salina]|uniref:histidine kinase n=1 Tax=Marinicauda salina TaxID=2135793 RepID=A0A2U2BXT5_9PROT|nr:HAMP domain-containing sensor histidine kinase [Marinicauda salina]PWE18807.1 sensor histidine kinase [Marinicauda salina]